MKLFKLFAMTSPKPLKLANLLAMTSPKPSKLANLFAMSCLKPLKLANPFAMRPLKLANLLTMGSMKPVKLANLFAMGLAVAALSSGCKHHTYTTPLPNGGRTGSQDTSTAGPGEKIGGSGTEGSTSSGPLASNPANAHQGWIEDASTLKADAVFFAFDSSVVRPGEESKVQAVADYLKSNPANAVRVEGNCDERGTAEYNRALGDRRALAVREELNKLGIDGSRVDTLSYGSDRPAVQGHDESAWKQNRRDEFIVLSPPAK